MNTRMRILALGTAAALWAGGVGAAAADDSSATIPGCHHGDDTGGTLAANPQVPCDFTVQQSSDPLAEHYRFAWNTFFAISWPAQQPDQLRGVPDQSKSFTDAGTPVWDTWKEKRQLYRVRSLLGGNIWSTTDPGPFQTPPTGHDPNANIPMCPGESAPSGQMRTAQSSKIDNFADETDEIGLVVLWNADTRYPTDESLIRYQVKFNADYWNYVRSNGFYATHQLNQFIAQTVSDSAPVGKVAFPMSSTGTDINGAIMLKTGWRMLGAEEDASNYYSVDMLYYDKEDGTTCFRSATFGMIAIHVVRKTETFPYFLYSTFEHKDNYPGVYAYANTNITNDATVPANRQAESCKSVPVPSKGTLNSAILPNGCGIEYTDPMHPIVGVTPHDMPQYKADRLIPARPQLSQVNGEADQITQGSVWNHYRLVGVQTLPVGGKVDDENPAADQDYYLANPVVETSQRFQYFTGDFAAPRIVNVYKSHDDGSRVMMGGCMGCHGAGAQGASRTEQELLPNRDFIGGSGGTDFSFTLQNVRNSPSEPTGAESIEDVCGEINLMYDEETLSCVPKS